jgi:hypothetical protein
LLEKQYVAGLAQLVVHLICNQGVGGSNPSAGTKLHTNQFLTRPAQRGFGAGTALEQDLTIRRQRFELHDTAMLRFGIKRNTKHGTEVP